MTRPTLSRVYYARERDFEPIPVSPGLRRLVLCGLGVAAIVAILLLAGCSLFTTASPQTGQQVTEAQLDAEEAAAFAKAQADANAEALRAQAELARIQREAEHRLMQEQAATDARLAEIAFEAESEMDGVRVDIAGRNEARAAALTGLRASYAAARADLDAKAGWIGEAAAWGQVALGSPVVQGAAGANPLVGLGVLLAGGLLGRLSGNKGAREREDKAWEESKREAIEAKRAEDAAWDEASREAERRLLMSMLTRGAAEAGVVKTGAPT